jgi:hypothetical protein
MYVERYDFDVSKCEKIFDLLLQEKHVIPGVATKTNYSSHECPE